MWLVSFRGLGGWQVRKAFLVEGRKAKGAFGQRQIGQGGGGGESGKVVWVKEPSGSEIRTLSGTSDNPQQPTEGFEG